MPQDDPTAARLERLEEAQMFADRRADLLSDQMKAMERRITDLNERLTRLHASVQQLNDPQPGPAENHAEE
jgi:prefoldin subunit 5